MNTKSDLIPKHGGYRRLKSFQIAQLIYDVTVRFCERYVSPKSRTYDQMVQAARSGVQNIAEGSQVSGTSKKMEMKLTNVARASLEELRLDYEDYLRQHDLPQLPSDHPALCRFKAARCSTLDEVRAWVHSESRIVAGHKPSSLTEGQGHHSAQPDQSVQVHAGPCTSAPIRPNPSRSIPPSALVANAALSLLNICCYLLDRQLAAQAAAFEQDGGFTERLYRHRRNIGMQK